jgi:hypothetical protein
MLGCVPATLAWSSKGHRLITSAALDAVELEGLDWSGSERIAIENAAVQPDLMRPRELPQLRAMEAPRHYLDLELLEGEALPEERWQYVNLLNRIAKAGDGKGLLRPDGDVTQIGTLPYALVESTQRLAAIFAQLRVRPRDPDLRIMAAHQAGFVAHYAQDLCQPLHTTVHHDGRARRDGSSPRTGIHRQVDSLLQSVSLEALDIADQQPLKPLFPAVVQAFVDSHSQVDRVYDLVDELADLDEKGRVDSKLHKFAQERYRRAVSFTADLIRTAWQLSSSVDLPDWAPQAD